MSSVADGLALLESFLCPADGGVRLLIHPRCIATSRALRDYRRARRSGQWQDYPEDPGYAQRIGFEQGRRDGYKAARSGNLGEG